jgi:nicotinamide mononucleotide (NMN) deamidase PncC
VMAERVRAKFGAELGVASSGVAGPQSDDVGHLWLAVAREGDTIAEEHHLESSSRLAMQASFTELALRLLKRVVA